MRKLLAATAAVVVIAAGCSTQSGTQDKANGQPMDRTTAASTYFPALVDVRVDMKQAYKDMNWEDRVSPSGVVPGCVDVVGQVYGSGLPDGADTLATTQQTMGAALAKHGFGKLDVTNSDGPITTWQAKDDKGSIAVVKFGGTTVSADIYYPAKQGECLK